MSEPVEQKRLDGVHAPVDVHGKWAVAAIDFHETRIYPVTLDASGRPERVIPHDPRGYYAHLHHMAGNPTGAYLTDSDEYWRTLAEQLRPASAILLLGHGTGKANASHHFITYAEKHESDVAAKILGDVRCDIGDLTDVQVLRIAQGYLDMLPARDAADRRNR